MTKRLIALFLVCILAIPILAVPASASGFTEDDSLSLWNIEQMLDQYYYAWTGIFENIEEKIEWLSHDIAVDLAGLFEALEDKFDELGDIIYTELDRNTSRIKVYFENIRADLTTHFANLSGWLTNHFNALSGWLTNHFNALSGWLSTHFTNLSNWLSSHFSNLSEWITAQTEAITSKLQNLVQILSNTDEDNQKEQQAGQIVDDQKSEIDDMVGVIETSPTVDMDSMDGYMGMVEYVYGEFGESNYTNLLRIFTSESPEISLMLTMSCIFCLMGFILYGKVG